MSEECYKHDTVSSLYEAQIEGKILYKKKLRTSVYIVLLAQYVVGTLRNFITVF